MKHIGLFEGIGGFSLAVRLMKWQTVAWCEWNPFCQQILKYHFPEAEGFGDITKIDFTKYANIIDILTGGFPCQPYSTAGKRLGKEDERHLWPQMLRAIREIQPRWVIGENVHGLVSWNGGLVFHEVQTDLENEGYEVFPYILPACGINAPHRRERVWFIAHHNRINGRAGAGRKNGKKINNSNEQSFTNTGLLGQKISEKQAAGIEQHDERIAANATGKRKRPGAKEQREDERSWEQLVRTEQGSHGNDNGEGRIITDTDAAGQWWNEWESKGKGDLWEQFPTQSPLCSGDDGIPTQLDGITFSKWRNESLKAYGNAIVPQVALQLLKVIDEIETKRLIGN